MHSLQTNETPNKKAKNSYFRYKTVTSQNVSSEALLKNFFYFAEKLCFVLKIFKFLYFLPYHDLYQIHDVMMSSST